jgi:hypothetical protein
MEHEKEEAVKMKDKRKNGICQSAGKYTEERKMTQRKAGECARV